jgi:hypothetical protein
MIGVKNEDVTPIFYARKTVSTMEVSPRNRYLLEIPHLIPCSLVKSGDVQVGALARHASIQGFCGVTQHLGLLGLIGSMSSNH